MSTLMHSLRHTGGNEYLDSVAEGIMKNDRGFLNALVSGRGGRNGGLVRTQKGRMGGVLREGGFASDRR